jgi:hypothetical protein
MLRGKRSNLCFHPPAAAADPEPMIAEPSTAFSPWPAPVVAGRTCHDATAVPSPVGGDCDRDSERVSGNTGGGPTRPGCTSRSVWTGSRLFWRPPLFRPKGGEAIGVTKRGQRSQVMLVTDGQGILLGERSGSCPARADSLGWRRSHCRPSVFALGVEVPTGVLQSWERTSPQASASLRSG